MLPHPCHSAPALESHLRPFAACHPPCLSSGLLFYSQAVLLNKATKDQQIKKKRVGRDPAHLTDIAYLHNYRLTLRNRSSYDTGTASK